MGSMAWLSRMLGRDSIGAAEARRRVASGALVIDVRTDSEVASDPVAGSLHIPLGRIEERIDEIPRDRELLTLCHSGVRSAMAAGRLARHGIAARSIRGGTIRWRSSARRS
jgi:rhodanese-related sulfurtransferase